MTKTKQKNWKRGYRIETLQRAGVTWEDLHDKAKVDRKLEEFDRRKSSKRRKP